LPQFRKFVPLPMKQLWINRFIWVLLAIWVVGTLPTPWGSLYALSTPQQVSKKKRPATKKSDAKRQTKKKRPTAKKSRKKKTSSKALARANAYVKRGNQKARKKDYAGALKDFQRAYKLNPSKSTLAKIKKLQAILKKKKARPTKKRAKRPAAPPKKAEKKPAVSAVPKVSAVKLASELYDYTAELNTSRRRLAQATKFLEPLNKQPLVKIESKPIFTTADYEQAADKEPGNIRLQRQLGLHYEALHEWEKAKDVYFRILARDPLNPDAHYYLGALYARLGAMDQARQFFEEALDLDPNHGATLEALSSIGIISGDRSFTTDVLKRSATQSPKGPARLLSQIRMRLDEQDYEGALSLAQEGERTFPSQVGFVYLEGVALQELGNINQAKKAFQTAIKLNPQHEESHLALANLYFDLGKYVYAALSFQDAIYLNPQNTEARYMQGLAYYNAAEWGRATQAWEDLLHYDQNNPLVRNLLAQAYYILAVEYNRLGQSGLGRTSFRKALSVNQNTNQWLAGALLTLGKYYRNKGMYSESLAAYREVVELKPNDATAYAGMGVTYWKMNERQLARDAWQRSLSLDPDNNEAKGWLILAQQNSS